MIGMIILNDASDKTNEIKNQNPMKNYLLITTAAAVVLAAGCHDYKADIDKLETEKAVLTQEANYKDSSLMTFINQFNEIETNLSAIETKQANISANSKSQELKGNQVERINSNIREINDLMKDNKAKIAALMKDLKKSNLKVGNFEKMVASLNDQLNEQQWLTAGERSAIARIRKKILEQEREQAQIDKLSARAKISAGRRPLWHFCGSQ